MTASGSVALVGAFTAFWLIALPLDRATTESQQQVLGLAAWTFLVAALARQPREVRLQVIVLVCVATILEIIGSMVRSEEHTSELQSQSNLVCRLLLEKKKQKNTHTQ